MRDQLENAKYISYIKNTEQWHELGKSFPGRYENTRYRGERANMNKRSSLENLEWILSP